MDKTILGIDPGTREMGIAVLTGRRLVAHGVHTLRNGERPYDLVGQARRVVLGYIGRFSPHLVAIEAPLRIATTRAAILTVISEELGARARELSVEVVELTPEEVRQRVAGDPRAKKLQVAETLVGLGFEELRPLIPVRPSRSALGLRPRDKYWLHMFDALAVALAVQRQIAAPNQEVLPPPLGRGEI